METNTSNNTQLRARSRLAVLAALIVTLIVAAACAPAPAPPSSSKATKPPVAAPPTTQPPRATTTPTTQPPPPPPEFTVESVTNPPYAPGDVTVTISLRRHASVPRTHVLVTDVDGGTIDEDSTAADTYSFSFHVAEPSDPFLLSKQRVTVSVSNCAQHSVECGVSAGIVDYSVTLWDPQIVADRELRIAAEVAAAVNEARADKGLAPLDVDPSMHTHTKSWTDHLLGEWPQDPFEQPEFRHGPDLFELGLRENLAGGWSGHSYGPDFPGAAARTVDQWVNSAVHLNTMMLPNRAAMSVAVSCDPVRGNFVVSLRLSKVAPPYPIAPGAPLAPAAEVPGDPVDCLRGST